MDVAWSFASIRPAYDATPMARTIEHVPLRKPVVSPTVKAISDMQSTKLLIPMVSVESENCWNRDTSFATKNLPWTRRQTCWALTWEVRLALCNPKTYNTNHLGCPTAVVHRRTLTKSS